MFIGAFKFAITGPPGVYSVLGSTNLLAWSTLGLANNPLGSVNFTDVTAHLSSEKFYRALRQSPPTNMAFVAPNTFKVGSPTDEVDLFQAFPPLSDTDLGFRVVLVIDPP